MYPLRGQDIKTHFCARDIQYRVTYKALESNAWWLRWVNQDLVVTKKVVDGTNERL